MMNYRLFSRSHCPQGAVWPLIPVWSGRTAASPDIPSFRIHGRMECTAPYLICFRPPSCLPPAPVYSRVRMVRSSGSSTRRMVAKTTTWRPPLLARSCPGSAGVWYSHNLRSFMMAPWVSPWSDYGPIHITGSPYKSCGPISLNKPKLVLSLVGRAIVGHSAIFDNLPHLWGGGRGVRKIVKYGEMTNDRSSDRR